MTKITQINAATGVVVEREMNAEELAQYEADQAAEIIKQAEAQAKAQAKESAQTKLAALGLTADDLKALGL